MVWARVVSKRPNKLVIEAQGYTTLRHDPIHVHAAEIPEQVIYCHSREAQDLPHLGLVNLVRRDELLLEHGLHVREQLGLRAYLLSGAAAEPRSDSPTVESDRVRQWSDSSPTVRQSARPLS